MMLAKLMDLVQQFPKTTIVITAGQFGGIQFYMRRVRQPENGPITDQFLVAASELQSLPNPESYVIDKLEESLERIEQTEKLTI